MGHETASLESGGQAPAQYAAAPHGSQPLALPLLVLSLPLIVLGALFVCCLLAVCAVLVFYVQVGADGLADFYQELRFDIPLKTQIGAALVGSLYIGVAGATICTALLRGRRGWAELVAFTEVRGGRRVIAAIFIATLAYAGLASLTISLLQDHRIVISGPTDLVLLGTITANLVVLAPCAEELLFRGWLYTGLRRQLSFWPSFVVTATLFAAIHWDANHRRFFLVLPLALALGLLREITGSIKPTIVLHAVYNLIIVVITLLET